MLYGGDEIGALVFDVGHHSFRIGYAQEDTPKAEIPSVVGVVEDGNLNGAVRTDALDIEKKPDPSNISSRAKRFIDTTTLSVARKGMEVVSFMKDGMIEDWDLFEKVKSRFIVHSQENPPTHEFSALLINKMAVIPSFFVCIQI